MSEINGTSLPAPTFSQKAWKVFQRVLLEMVPPSVFAIISTWLTLKGGTPWNWSDALPVLSSTFVAWGMLWGVILRSAKNVTDTTRHESLLIKQQQLVVSLQSSAVDMAGYATGGDTYARVHIANVEHDERGPCIKQLTYMATGKYPLYDLRLSMVNMDDPEWLRGLKAGNSDTSKRTVQLGELIPGFGYTMPVYIPLLRGRQKNRIHLNWKARNGSWYQRLEITQIDGVWRMATFGTRGIHPDLVEIFVTADAEYERDEAGRPMFDTSPTVLE